MSNSALAERAQWQRPTLVALAQNVTLSQGWTRRAIAFISGAAGALAMAPFNVIPALIVPLVVGVWLIDGAAEAGASRRTGILVSMRAAAFDGWWLGFGYFVAGLWWLGDAFLVEADRFAWALPLGLFGLPAILALFTAFGFATARLLWLPGAVRVFALAVGVGLAEWLRGHLFTGFPWNLFGMALGGNLVLAQAASLVGIYGLTLIALAVFAAPATLIDGNNLRARWPTVAAVIVLAALALFGALRLGLGHDPGYVAGVKLRIMQPNLSQNAKFRPEYRDAILQRYLSLSDRATSPQNTGLADVTHLIWPESAFPFILGRDAGALAQIGSALPPRTTLITGAARMDSAVPGRRPQSEGSPVFNAVQVIASGGTILDSSDKAHLVPFGEYLPFASLLNRIGLRQFVAIPGGFESGERRKALQVPGLPPVSPLICYEVIFSGEVMPQIWPTGSGTRPGLLLNVTNDGWFGTHAGPHQHFAQARLRSIEEGLPLIRAANTGISAIVDAYGRVLEELPVGVEGLLDGKLPAGINPTFFARFGNLPAFAIWTILLTLLLFRRRTV
ncbi:MAG: apolipoprotein N-acyltransferase [Methylobacteriaceae bacterium]|nr:apolipoprotein N-acyltransferase [Methylobacteriaceae bacterium]